MLLKSHMQRVGCLANILDIALATLDQVDYVVCLTVAGGSYAVGALS